MEAPQAFDSSKESWKPKNLEKEETIAIKRVVSWDREQRSRQKLFKNSRQKSHQKVAKKVDKKAAKKVDKKVAKKCRQKSKRKNRQKSRQKVD